MTRQSSPISGPGAIRALEAFQQATAFHRQGRLWEAEQLYAVVLKGDDRHFDCIYRLGLIRLQQGRLSDAEPLFRRAIKIDRNSAEALHQLAVALTGLGRLQEAVQRYEKAVAIRPGFAEAHNSLGHALQMLGRSEEAIGHCEKALALKPRYEEAHNNLGNALHRLGRSEAAIAQFRKALAIRPNYPEAHNNFAHVLGALGRHEEAVAHCERAIAIRPDYADAHINLGSALASLGRHQQAALHYEKALAIRPNDAQPHAALGDVLHMLGRSQEAIGHYEKALLIKPDFAEAHSGLGVLLLALGKVDEAGDAFERAIALAPRQAQYYLKLGACRKFAEDDRHLDKMRELERDMASLPVEDQIALEFALGKALLELGDHQQSLSHLLRGNSLKRQQITYDEAETLRRFERIRSVFSSELMREKRGLGHPSAVPAFIIGMPRSGTTLIEQILASHPEVHGGGELPVLGNLAASISGPKETSFPEAVAAMPGEQLFELGENYLRAVRSMAPAAERVVDKMMTNFTRAGLIHLALPNARIIHIRRDPRDTALSCFSILFRGGLEYTYDLAELGRYYRGYLSLMDHWRKVLPEGVMLDLEYEEVVGNLEQQARRVIAHCGLAWNDACLAFYKTERIVRTASATQVRRPIYRSSIGRWRAYGDLLQPFMQALEDVQAAQP